MKNIMWLIMFIFWHNLANKISLPMKEIDELQNKNKSQRSKL